MNPLTNVRNIQKLSETELQQGTPIKNSWHQQYKDSAWIFFGGLNYDLTEGDVICVFSQYGEIVNVNLIRDQKTGKTKGFGFLCYEDQRSTILAVDNLNGIKLLSRTIRVDHVEEYKVPKMKEDMDPERKKLMLEGCAPQLVASPVPVSINKETVPDTKIQIKKEAKEKKSKHKHKKQKKKKKRKYSSDSESSSDSSEDERSRKRKKHKR